ncbi:MAG: filamentous hemagglutinin N-terminal domain-containing protein, partial [Haliea sp.]
MKERTPMNNTIHRRHLPPFALSAFVVAAMACFGTANAAPAGGTVAAGTARISSAANTTTVTQSSQAAVINWQSFGIAAGESVRFVQPGASAVVLNRVTGPDPSAIYGNLSANGKVFLVNSAGILFGSGASVNVGGLVASTLNITDSNFLAGRLVFSGAGSGSVTNQGVIRADGGYVALLGASVSNTGHIQADMGSVVLGAGKAITMEIMPGGLLDARVDEGAVSALAQNGGLIQANGGQVLMTAQAAGVLLGTVVNNTGVIRAQSISTRNGSIRLLGDMDSGTVNVAGTLDVSGRNAGETGGKILVTGHHTGLFAAAIDASGDAGGGTVLVGGGFQGRDAGAPNASATYMSADSGISADALSRGNGGTVVLWANDSTRAAGVISARGGAVSGDGGMVETSGHWLGVTGINVNASAPHGAGGTWLLDPADVTIGAGTTNGSFAANVFTPDSGQNAATVDVGALRSALEAGGGTNVTITTANNGAPGAGFGDITVAAALTWTPATASTLTLNAARDVNINADISATRGNLVVCCGRDINVRARVTTTNGSVLLSAGRDLNMVRMALDPLTPLLSRTNVAGIVTTQGNITMCAARDVNLINTFDAAALITLTNSSTTGGLDLAELGVKPGMLISAGTGGTGPGIAGGTAVLSPLAAGTSLITVTDAEISVHYNPVSYLAPTDYSSAFTRTNAPLAQRMLVFPQGDKTADGSQATTLSTLKGNPPGVTLIAGPGATANFDTAAVGIGKPISFSGYTLDAASQTSFALPLQCCGPLLGMGLTTGSIAA